MAPFSLTPAPLVDPGDAGECWRADQVERFRSRLESLSSADASLASELRAAFEAVLRETEALSELLDAQRSGERAAPWWADGEYDASAAEARNREAVEAFARGDAAAALTAALEAVRLDPAPAAHHDNAAAAALALARPEVALEEARQAIRRDAGRATARERAARALAALGRYDEAAEEAELAAKAVEGKNGRGRERAAEDGTGRGGERAAEDGTGRGGERAAEDGTGRGGERAAEDGTGRDGERAAEDGTSRGGERLAEGTAEGDGTGVSAGERADRSASTASTSPSAAKASALRRFAAAMRRRARESRAAAREARLRSLLGSRPAMPLRLPPHDEAAAALEAARTALEREPGAVSFLLARAEAALAVGADDLALASTREAAEASEGAGGGEETTEKARPAAHADAGAGRPRASPAPPRTDLVGWDAAVTLAEVLWRQGHLTEARAVLRRETEAWERQRRDVFGGREAQRDRVASPALSRPEKAQRLEALLDRIAPLARPLTRLDAYFELSEPSEARDSDEGRGPDEGATPARGDRGSGARAESSDTDDTGPAPSADSIPALLRSLSRATEPACPLSAAAPGLWASALRGAALALLPPPSRDPADLAEALRLASQALSAKPESPASHATMARALHALGRHTEAYLAVREALRFAGSGGREGDARGDRRLEALETTLARAAERAQGRDVAEAYGAPSGGASSSSQPPPDGVDFSSAPSAVRAALDALFAPDGVPVPEDASARLLSFALVRAAFKRQATAWHPDRWPRASKEERANAEERFKDAGSAFELVERWARDEGWIGG